MLGKKFKKQNFNHIMNNVKSHVRHGYHHTKNFLGQLDNGVRTAKQIYSVVESSSATPLLALDISLIPILVKYNFHLFFTSLVAGS